MYQNLFVPVDGGAESERVITMKERVPTTLRQSRTIAATPSQIYDVWLDQGSPRGPWFGSTRAIVNTVVDVLFTHAVEHGGRGSALYGRFVRLESPSLITEVSMSEVIERIETTRTT